MAIVKLQQLSVHSLCIHYYMTRIARTTRTWERHTSGLRRLVLGLLRHPSGLRRLDLGLLQVLHPLAPILELTEVSRQLLIHSLLLKETIIKNVKHKMCFMVSTELIVIMSVIS